jgi:CubicO group peptidase (beta-lactamase class C family)
MKIFKSVIVFLLFFLGCRDSLRESQVDQLFFKWNKLDSPGCSLGIINHGQLIYHHNYGMAQPASQIPINDSTVFYIGSMSKQFTAMCILLLAERGKLSLNNEIQKYIPEFPNYGHLITIQNLIHHTSGIQDYLLLWMSAGKSYADLNSIDDSNSLDLLVRQTSLNFIPGERYEYSNSNYFLLGIIIKKISGKSLREFAYQNIFQPLGMNHTQYRDNMNIEIKNQATGHLLNTNKKSEPLVTAYHLVGDGGVYTTIDDLVRWDQNFYHNLLGEKNQNLIDRFYEKGKLNNGESIDYAFGIVNTQIDGMKAIEHGGQFIGYKSDILRFPEKQFTVIILCNSEAIDAQQLTIQVAEKYLTKQVN